MYMHVPSFDLVVKELAEYLYVSVFGAVVCAPRRSSSAMNATVTEPHTFLQKVCDGALYSESHILNSAHLSYKACCCCSMALICTTNTAGAGVGEWLAISCGTELIVAAEMKTDR